MKYIRILINTIFQLKYSMAVSAFLCSTILTTLQLKQLPVIPGSSIFFTYCWFWCRYLPGFACMGLFGGICALLVLKWKPNSKLIAMGVSLLVPFIFFSTFDNVWSVVWRLLNQMAGLSASSYPSFIIYFVGYLWLYCLPGFIGGLIVIISQKEKKIGSVSLLSSAGESSTISTETKVRFENVD